MYSMGTNPIHPKAIHGTNYVSLPYNYYWRILSEGDRDPNAWLSNTVQDPELMAHFNKLIHNITGDVWTKETFSKVWALKEKFECQIRCWWCDKKRYVSAGLKPSLAYAAWPFTCTCNTNRSNDTKRYSCNLEETLLNRRLEFLSSSFDTLHHSLR